MNSSDEVEHSLISASPISPWIGHLFTLQLQQPVSNPDDIYKIHVNQTSNLTPAIKIYNLLTWKSMDEPVVYNRKLHPHFEEGGGGYIVLALSIIPIFSSYFSHKITDDNHLIFVCAALPSGPITHLLISHLYNTYFRFIHLIYFHNIISHEMDINFWVGGVYLSKH